MILKLSSNSILSGRTPNNNLIVDYGLRCSRFKAMCRYVLGRFER